LNKGLIFVPNLLRYSGILKFGEEDMELSISEFAHRYNVELAAVEAYAKNGLIGHLTAETQAVVLDDTDRFWLNTIDSFLETGTSMSELKTVLKRCHP